MVKSLSELQRRQSIPVAKILFIIATAAAAIVTLQWAVLFFSSCLAQVVWTPVGDKTYLSMTYVIVIFFKLPVEFQFF
jgi:hypothetical protein